MPKRFGIRVKWENGAPKNSLKRLATCYRPVSFHFGPLVVIRPNVEKQLVQILNSMSSLVQVGPYVLVGMETY